MPSESPSPSRSELRVGLVGARGRMGQQVLQHTSELQHVRIAALLLRDGASRLEAVGGASAVQTSDLSTFVGACDVVLDFCAPPIASRLAPVCAELERPYVLASTGLGAAEEAALQAAQTSVPIIVAANLSLGISALEVLLEQAGRLLPDWDAELVETHHRHKRDAPSGTARALGRALMRGTGPLDEETRGAERTAPRPSRSLGYSVVRGGDVPGDHALFLLGEGERLELVHRAQSPRLFAQGALVACAFVAAAKRAPGRYAMRDVLLAQHT